MPARSAKDERYDDLVDVLVHVSDRLLEFGQTAAGLREDIREAMRGLPMKPVYAKALAAA